MRWPIAPSSQGKGIKVIRTLSSLLHIFNECWLIGQWLMIRRLSPILIPMEWTGHIRPYSLFSSESCQISKGNLMNASYQFAGLQRAKEPGLSVEECARRIHRLSYVEERLMFLQAAHIVTTPQRDLKGLLSRLQYEDGLHSDLLKNRMTELRVSKAKSYSVPDDGLKIVLDEALHSDGSVELLAALAKVFKPALLEAYRNYVRQTNGLADYESVRLMRNFIAEEEETLGLLEAAYEEVVKTSEDKELATWLGWHT